MHVARGVAGYLTEAFGQARYWEASEADTQCHRAGQTSDQRGYLSDEVADAAVRDEEGGAGGTRRFHFAAVYSFYESGQIRCHETGAR